MFHGQNKDWEEAVLLAKFNCSLSSFLFSSFCYYTLSVINSSCAFVFL